MFKKILANTLSKQPSACKQTLRLAAFPFHNSNATFNHTFNRNRMILIPILS